MSPRVAGAALALLAAAMLVASIAGIPGGWWSGHPLRNGEAMHKKDVDVSLLTAVGCNTGGDGTCEPLELSGAFEAVRYVELGASGLLVLACLLLAGVTLAGSERRKGLGQLVIATAVAAAVVGGALLFLPKMKATGIELPIGPGVFVFFGGVACALLGSILAMRPTPKLELQPPRQSFAPGLGAPPTAQPVDVLAMLQPDARPPAPDPRPPLPDLRPPPSPGGQLAGPAGPLAPPQFGSAPPTPHPAQPAPFAARPPDPRARSGSAAPPLPAHAADRPRSASTMPALPGDRSKSSSQMPGLPGDRSKSSSQLPALSGDRSKSSSQMPALPGVDRAKPSSVPPPSGDAGAKPASVPPPSGAARSTAASAAPSTAGARTKAASIGPPNLDARTKAATIPPPSGDARKKPASVPPASSDARAKPASVPPPSSAPRTKPASVPPPSAPSLGPIPSTVAGMMPPSAIGGTHLPPTRAKGPSVPPPGGSKSTSVSAVVPPPAGPLVSTMLPMRADTDPSEELETMARDGASSSIGDNTDASVSLPESAGVDERTDLAAQPIEPRDSASDIQTSMQRKLTASELVRTVARESQTEIETIAREKLSARELAIGDSTSPAVHSDGGRAEAARRSAKEIRDLGEAPTAPARVGLSTASQSLPPPKKAEAVAAGPTPACPQCEAPMAWVEEHLRFYCKSCRMYF